MRSTDSNASGSLASRSQITTVRPAKAPCTAASGPLNSVPHIGCVATKRPRRGCCAITSQSSCLVDPISITTWLSSTKFSTLTASSGIELTGVANTIRSAPATAAGNSSKRSTNPSSNALLRFGSELSTPTTSAASPFSLSVSANDPPISPTPTTAIFICLSIFPFSIVCQRFCTSITT